MGLQGYVGSSEDQRRIERMEKKRQKARSNFENLKKQSDANVDAAGLRQFGAGSAETLEAAFKNETVGLVTKEEFMTKRATLKERLDRESLQAKRAAEEEAAADKERRRQKKAKQAAKSKLSFGVEEEEEGEEAAEEAPPQAQEHAEAGPADDAAGGGGSADEQETKYAKLGKDPSVRTEFLPDKDRELAEETLRQQLKKEWLLRQQVVKNEPLEITYSYWDGAGHRRKAAVRKGDTIADFLKACREQLAPEFRELRAVSVTNLIYVKEDLMIPHHYSFYELIVNKARGKSGPLFHFDVHDDVRLQNDARVEKDESHAGKVVERHWYNRNKHIFPASRWELYDPEKSYGGGYSVYG